MTIEHESGKVRVVLDPREVKLLRHALERALFIDTPVADQEAIMTFSNRLLDFLEPGGAASHPPDPPLTSRE